MMEVFWEDLTRGMPEGRRPSKLFGFHGRADELRFAHRCGNDQRLLWVCRAIPTSPAPPERQTGPSAGTFQ